MGRIDRQLNWLLAAAVLLLALGGLLFGLEAGNTVITWAAFLGAVALVLGVLNLLAVHLRRSAQRNPYSMVLVLAMLAVFAMPITDRLGLTMEGAERIFALVQAPMEAALAALLAFFLLFAGVRLLRRERLASSLLFLGGALLVLLASVPLPGGAAEPVRALHELVAGTFVDAGVRGILIGIALGTLTMALRLLIGRERPYNK
jgi:uncharacterized membrane protein HdeD (DUF308 family)